MSSAIFEFDFVAPKPSTKVDSVFDLVNGNGQNTTSPEPEHIVDDAGPLSMEWNDTYNSPWSTDPETSLQAADSALDAATILDELQTNHDELILTQSEVLDGSTSTTLIKSPDIFEFEHSETLEPASDLERLGHDGYVAAVNAELDKQNAEKQQEKLLDLEAEYQSQLHKWNKDYEQAKINWDAEKHTTEQEQIALALEVKRISDELKEVRQSHKSVIATLEDLIKVGPAYPEKPVKGKLVQPSTNQPAAASPDSPMSGTSMSTPHKDPNQSVSNGSTDQSWREIKSETFLTIDIEGMGQKKLDTLLHEYPTLGDLVDLQTESSKKCLHLSKLLPKGVGKKLADSIDNAIMDAFAKYCQPV